jgi:hypothetical protein
MDENKNMNECIQNQQDEVKCDQQSELQVVAEKPIENQSVEVFVTGLSMVATTL